MAGVLAAGAYAGDGSEQHLLEGPVWTRTGIDPAPAAAEYTLDLYGGVLYRTQAVQDSDFHSLRFACADRPGVFAMRVRTRARIVPGPPLRAPAAKSEARVTEIPVPAIGATTDTACLRVSSASAAITAAAAQSVAGEGLDRVAACAIDRDEGPGAGRVLRMVQGAWTAGIDDLLTSHRRAWAARWADVGIEISGDPGTELAVRFALFQLWCNADAHGESAVGARGISGPGYRGHIFWDTDVFVLPAVVSIDPRAAAAMIAYRINRLPAARQRARAEGRRGARFPWESAADGGDVTPRAGYLGGTAVPIRTGAQEEHITADIAWAVDRYAEWTGNAVFRSTSGRALLTETARYWASRVRLDAGGRAHIDDVIGPDEYHEGVDDNAFTNVMARWNLRLASRLAPENPDETVEFALWRSLADRVVDQSRADGRYEQFTGYFDLEPLTVGGIASPPVAADILLGRARVAGSQLIKQPDVLMLHHLVPDEVLPGSLPVNLDFYGPRTTHGSSLSPAITAGLLARAGRPEDALRMLDIALRLDLDDRTATTASGLHMATLGGVWQAILTGFAGVVVRDGVLSVRPVLPARWRRLRLAFRCLGRRIRLDVTPGRIAVEADGPVVCAVDGRAPTVIPGGSRWSTTERGSS